MRNLWNICAGLLVAGSLLLFTGCETRVGAGGGAYYDYDYYPVHNVYYYPHDRIYYWNDSGRWRSGRNLPSHYDVHEERRESVHTHSRQPWTEHHEEHNDSDHHGSDHDRH